METTTIRLTEDKRTEIAHALARRALAGLVAPKLTPSMLRALVGTDFKLPICAHEVLREEFTKCYELQLLELTTPQVEVVEVVDPKKIPTAELISELLARGPALVSALRSLESAARFNGGPAAATPETKELGIEPKPIKVLVLGFYPAQQTNFKLRPKMIHNKGAFELSFVNKIISLKAQNLKRVDVVIFVSHSQPEPLYWQMAKASAQAVYHCSGMTMVESRLLEALGEWRRSGAVTGDA